MHRQLTNQLRGMLGTSPEMEHHSYPQTHVYRTEEHAIPGGGPTPAFLSKLWQLVNDQDNCGLVSWSSNGRSFIVFDQVKFSKQILPNYFKHQKMNSFVRQLNMYGFKKVPKLHEGTLHSIENDQIEFANDLFLRGQPDLISQIKRKDTKKAISAAQAKIEPAMNNPQLTELLQELSEQQKQTHRDFDSLKEENGDLYRQVGALRRKHEKQQATVDRLITFMIHFIQQSGTAQSIPQIGSKRSAEPLMLTGSDSKRLNIEEYHEDHQTQQRKLPGEIVLSKSRHEPTYTKLEKRQDYSRSNENDQQPQVVQKIQTALSRQQSTLSSIMGMVQHTSTSLPTSNSYSSELNFNQQQHDFRAT